MIGYAYTPLFGTALTPQKEDDAPTAHQLN